MTDRPAQEKPPRGEKLVRKGAGWRAVSWEAWGTWFRRHHWTVQDLLSVAALAALCVLVRRVWQEPIEIGGDAVRKWHFARQWFTGYDFSDVPWDHHMARAAINIPAFCAQQLFGTEPSVYYAVPLAAAALTVPPLYGIGRRCLGRLAAVAACILFIYFPPMFRAGTQLLPGGFGALYLTVAAYCYVRFEDAGDRDRRYWLAGCAVSLFAAYSAQITNLFAAPGFAVALLSSRRNWRDLVLFSGLLFALFCVETLLFSLWSPHAHRLAIIEQAHGASADRSAQQAVARGAQSAKSFNLTRAAHKVAARFRYLDEYFKRLFWFAFAAWLGCVSFLKDRRIHGVALALGSCVFLLTFAIRRFQPFTLWMSYQQRYFTGCVPLLMFVVAVFSAAALLKLRRRLFGRWLEGSWMRRVGAAPAVYALALTGSLYAWTAGANDKRLERDYPTRADRLGAFLSDAYARGIPIVSSRTRHHKALRAVYSVYLPASLLTPKDGALPRFEDALQRSGRLEFVVRDNDIARAKRLIRGGCKISVRLRRVRFLHLDGRWRVPRACQRFEMKR